MRKQTLAQVAVFTLAIVLLATSISEAQRRKQRGGQRGPGGFGNPLAILENETLQKELGLTAAQKQRVKEISLQLQGRNALTTDPIVKELGISDSQKEKIQQVNNSMFTRLREAFGQGGRDLSQEERTKRFREIGEKMDKEAFAVLTSSQSARWKKMIGKPADVSKIRPTFGGRRGGPGARPKARPKSDI